MTPNEGSSQPPNTNPTKLPTTRQLIEISTLLKDEPIPKILSTKPEIPRILLTAAKRGINEDITSETTGTNAMVRSLLALSKTSILAKRNQDTPKPSPFSKTRAAKLSKSEMETITRAGKWANALLTDCVRATLSEKQSPASRISHSTTDTVFTAPRDKLDPVLAERYANQATLCLTHPAFRRNLPALLKVQAFLMSTAAISQHHAILCIPVLETALHIFSSAPAPLLASQQSSCALVQCSDLQNPQLDSISELSRKAQGQLCAQSPGFRKTFTEQVQQLFSSRKIMSYATERETIKPLAQAAVIDLNFHWELMDHVRDLVSASNALFSLHVWDERHFFRALFSETIKLIESEHIHETAHHHLVNRFPPFGRPIVRLLSALSASLQSQDVHKRRMAVSMATNLIWKMLDIEKDVIWTPNVHSFMICVESLLELFCWATTFSLKLDSVEPTLPKKRRKSQQGDPLTCVCYLSARLEITRLPGGDLVESNMQLRSTALSMRDFLMQVSRKRQLDLLTAFRENRIRGLSAFALSGILTRHDLDISVKSCEAVTHENVEDVHRSLEKCTLWTKDPTMLSRYKWSAPESDS